MSIMWKYLDKRSATIAAIKDYESMQFIINSTDDEIKRVHEKMTSVGSPKWDGMPRTNNPQAGEERILTGRLSSIWTGSNRHGSNFPTMTGTALRPFTATAIPTVAARHTTLPSTCMSSRPPRISERTGLWTG